ncbi:MAG TPA: hypothetical protein VMU24_03405 [Candidatus Acidoferrales bacterium]|nr:hypothetical protein [Candidatus Acidoferrales bacterium]
MAGCLLLFDYDYGLLHSRALVLSYMGWQVQECSNAGQAAEAMCAGPCEAMLLSSGLALDDALRVVPMFRRRYPSAMVIQLVPSASAELLPGVDYVISTEYGVLPFIQDLKCALEPREQRAAKNGA